MEELQSTEALDREILEDARKKAYRILRNADESVKVKAAEWEQKTNETLENIKKRYSGRSELEAAEIMTRLPLDRRRAKAEKIESLLRLAAENWYAGLGRDRTLALLQNGLAKRLAECEGLNNGDGPLRAFTRNLEPADADAVLKKVLSGKQYVVTESPSGGAYPEIILENDKVRITASIQKAIDFFLSEKRAELAGALLGQTVLLGEEI